MTAEVTQLRVDAQDNRDRILAAARSLFATMGLDVGMREIARAAHVGPATLYRRFPTKQSLIDAAFALELHTCRAIVLEGCADPDPWRGLTDVIRRLTALNSQNRGFVAAFTSVNSVTSDFAEHRQDLYARLAGLVDRAKATGRLRADFVMDDLLLLLLAGRGLASAGNGRQESFARRFAQLAIDGLQATAAPA
ncbi:TetR/AcrR family transcriptional regulator [Humibacter soli]